MPQIFERWAISLSQCNISLNSEKLEVVEEFWYLGVKFGWDRSGKLEFKSKVLHGRKIGSALKALVNGKNLNVECMRSLHQKELVSTLMYGCETLLYLGQDR